MIITLILYENIKLPRSQINTPQWQSLEEKTGMHIRQSEILQLLAAPEVGD
jgi:hypothetical protein